MSKPVKLRKSIRYFGYLLISVVILLELGLRLFFSELRDTDKFMSQLLTRVSGSTENFADAFFDPCGAYPAAMKADYFHEVRVGEIDFSFTTNHAGFRSLGSSGPIQDTCSIMLLGDSFLFGWGLADSLTPEMNLVQMLQERKKLATVCNLATPGTNNLHALFLGNHFLSQKMPEKVILGVYLGNDLIPNAWGQWSEDGEYSVSESQQEHLKALLNSEMGLLTHSMICRWLTLHFFHLRMRYRISNHAWVLEHSTKAWLRFNQLCKVQGVQFSLIFIPPSYFRSRHLLRGTGELDLLRLKLNDFCSGEGISSLDFGEILEGRGNPHHYYFAEDGHLNPDGAALLAQSIADSLF